MVGSLVILLVLMQVVEVLLQHVATVLGSTSNLKKPTVELRGALSSAGLEAVDAYGHTPAQLARIKGHPEVAMFLEDWREALVLTYPELGDGWASPGSSDRSSVIDWEEDYVVRYEKEDVKEAMPEEDDDDDDDDDDDEYNH